MRLHLNAKYLLRLTFATAFLVCSTYVVLLTTETFTSQNQREQSQQQHQEYKTYRHDDKWKVIPPDKLEFDLRGLESRVIPGDDGEGIDFESVLRDLEEERIKFSHKNKEPKEAFVAETTTSNSVNDALNKTKYILYWNEAYGSRKYGFCCGKDPFVEFKCPVNDCFVTDDRDALGEGNVDQFDAVLFHLREMSKRDLPEKRREEQRYIMFMLESAHYMMGHDSRDWNDFFNWTLTYRLDSDFPMPYGKFKKIRDHPTDPEELSKLIRDFGKANKHLGKGKKDKAAWFVSNCESMSQREKYVEVLEKHFDVDIYGACGNMTCDKRHTEECWKKVDEDYKFYLALENSVCVDYATEKFFNPLAKAKSVLPVVMGGADYAGAIGAPYLSYLSIHESEDWERRPATLAKELKRLSSDSAAFAERFWWRDYYEVRQGKAHLAETFCDLCAALHDPNRGRQSYEDLKEWWERKARCRRMRRTYR